MPRFPKRFRRVSRTPAQPAFPIPDPFRDTFDQQEWDTLHVALMAIGTMLLIVDGQWNTQRESAFRDYATMATISDDDLVRELFRSFVINQPQVVDALTTGGRPYSQAIQDAAAVLDQSVSPSDALTVKNALFDMATTTAAADDASLVLEAGIETEWKIAEVASWLGLDTLLVDDDSPDRSIDTNTPLSRLDLLVKKQTRWWRRLRRLRRSVKEPDRQATAGPSDLASEVGRRIIEPTFDTMRIDKEWSVWDSRGFSWWADDLKQRVEASRAIPSRGVDITVVTASTDLVCDISKPTRAIHAANSLNMSAGMSSVVLNPTDETARLVSSVAVHSDTLYYARMFSVATAFQIAEATRLADVLAESLGGRPHTSHHPANGLRGSPDEMLEMIDHLPMRDDPVPLEENDFKEALEATTNPQGESLILLGNTSPHGLIAEFPFYHAVPSMLLAARGSNAPPGTALLTLSVRDDEANVHWASAEGRIGPPPLTPRHMGAYARYGSGLHIRLGLPILIDEEEAILQASVLNGLESDGASMNHLIGSWFAESGGLWFTAYFPNFLLAPLNHPQRITELVNIIAAQAARVQWARSTLDGHDQHQ